MYNEQQPEGKLVQENPSFKTIDKKLAGLINDLETTQECLKVTLSSLVNPFNSEEKTIVALDNMDKAVSTSRPLTSIMDSKVNRGFQLIEGLNSLIYEINSHIG